MTKVRSPHRWWHPGPVVAAYARVMVSLRWLVVGFWLAAVAAAVLLLPGIGGVGSDISDLVSADSPAVQSEIRSLRKFGFPLLSRVAVVQRNPDGLPMETQAQAVERAQAVSKGEYEDTKPIVAAVPVSNTLKLFPGSQESGTTIITLLFTTPDVTYNEQLQAAQRFVDNHFEDSDHVIGITGSIPARVEQGRIVNSSVPLVEFATLAAVLLIVAIAFRSLIAPLVTLAVAGVAVLLTLHIGGALADRLDIAVPAETQPLLVALLLGVVTDYVIFYLSAMRNHLETGAGRLAAAQWATARFTTIIATAGATAAAGTGALIVAGSPAFRAFGPGMALAVFIGMLVAVTLVPALLAILGSFALWPGHRRRLAERANGSGPKPARWLTRPGFAVIVASLCVVGLLAAAFPLRNLTLGVSLIPSLPGDHPARKAAVQAETGFADGILSPTELLLEGPGLASKQASLAQLQQSLAKQPGVAGVVGPGDELIPESLNLFHTADGTAVRYLLILSDRPHGAQAVETLSRLDRDLPQLMEQAGLGGTQVGLGGDTAIAKAMVDQTMNDLGRIALAALLANLLFLVLFLRALVAPLFLLACSLLALAATMGLTTLLFEDYLGQDGLTFYVPFAAAVLLVALGSDYNIFGVGHAWKEAEVRPLREALALTIPESAHAIRTAGITLATSFGLLALVPLRPFRELAFALTVGILLDAFIVRSLLVPSLLTIAGSGSGWPSRHLFSRRMIHLRARRAGVEDNVPVGQR